MDLYEYQARDIFEAYGVPVLRGITATTTAEAKEAAAAIGTPVVVVKAQVKTGGRGKGAVSRWRGVPRRRRLEPLRSSVSTSRDMSSRPS